MLGIAPQTLPSRAGNTGRSVGSYAWGKVSGEEGGVLCLPRDELLASCRWDFPWDDLGAAAVPCPEQTRWEQGNLESGDEITVARPGMAG